MSPTKTWIDKFRHRLAAGAKVIDLSGNLYDLHITGILTGLQEHRQILADTLKPRPILICSLANGLQYDSPKSESHFARPASATAASNEAGESQGSTGPIIAQIRQAQQAAANQEISGMLQSALAALRQPGNAVIFERFHNFHQDPLLAHRVRDFREHILTDLNSIAEGSVAVFLHGQDSQTLAAQENGLRICVIRIEDPDQSIFEFALKTLELSAGRVNIEIGQISQLAATAVEVGIKVRDLADLYQAAALNREPISPRSIHLHNQKQVGIENLSEDRFRTLIEVMDQEVMGQDRAKQAIQRYLRIARAGLKRKHRPIGVFILIGSTGVGKTQLVKAIARGLYGNENRMIRVDMGEYSEAHSVSRLTGSPPGYLGYEEGGGLVGQVRAQPCSVILFDEIEKGHSKVFHSLLQVLDDGRMTDGQGNVACFDQTIIFMTSNLGAREGEGQPAEVAEAICQRALREHFKPEFLGRITHTLYFHPIGKDILAQIVRKELNELCTQVRIKKEVDLIVDDEVVADLVQNQVHTLSGARSIQHLIQDHVGDKVAAFLLDNNPPPRSTIRLSIKGVSLVSAFTGPKSLAIPVRARRTQ